MPMLEKIQTTAETMWKLHEIYRDRFQAEAMAIFYVNHVPYKAAKIVADHQQEMDIYQLYVLVNR